MVYHQCGPLRPQTCDNYGIANCAYGCAEGCFCPDGLVLNDGNCIEPLTCPGKLYADITIFIYVCMYVCVCIYVRIYICNFLHEFLVAQASHVHYIHTITYVHMYIKNHIYSIF